MGASCRCRRKIPTDEEAIPVQASEAERDELLEADHEQFLADPPRAEVLADTLGILSRAYAGTGWGDDTADWEGVLSVDSTNAFSNSALYGEISEQDFADLLFGLGLRPPAVVYDLGSGTGKLVNLAALLGFSATGIELEPGRHQRACWQQLRRASAALAALCAYQLPGLRLFRCGLCVGQFNCVCTTYDGGSRKCSAEDAPREPDSHS